MTRIVRFIGLLLLNASSLRSKHKQQPH
ncbi:leu operon leader peptide [Escherichia coli]